MSSLESSEPGLHLGGRFRPIHIHPVQNGFTVYECGVGTLTYIGFFTEEEFLPWLKGILPDPPKRQLFSPSVPRTAPLNIDLDISL